MGAGCTQYNLHCSYDPMRMAYATAVLIDRGAQPAKSADQPRLPAMSSIALTTPICGLSGECWWLVCVCVLMTSKGIVAHAASPPAAAPAVEFTSKTYSKSSKSAATVDCSPLSQAENLPRSTRPLSGNRNIIYKDTLSQPHIWMLRYIGLCAGQHPFEGLQKRPIQCSKWHVLEKRGPNTSPKSTNLSAYCWLQE